jgi:hypothetical protein
VTKGEVLRRVRAKCLDCGCGSFKEVELCPVEGCALWPLRFGRDPNPARGRPAIKKGDLNTFYS